MSETNTENLARLLLKTSRTFALSIPMLPEPVRGQVTTAYLLFRIADTLEDAAGWPRAKRMLALSEFSRLLGDGDEGNSQRVAAEWSARPVAHDGYRELLQRMPLVLRIFRSLALPAREIVRAHLLRTSAGMAGYVSRAGEAGELVLQDLEDLQAYCYAVAGIVGEMLTELFLVNEGRLAGVAGDLRSRAATFGEGLQLVNILKDARDDVSEGRQFLAPEVPRAEVFDLARQDLATAAHYVRIVQSAGASRGTVGFNALPVLLARATLERVERRGPGAKLTRPEVFSIVTGLEDRLDTGEPAMPEPASDGRSTSRSRD
jgi:farnesyl-diphosphate farnesyltransferase